MRKTGLVIFVLLLANLGLAIGQELPNPLPENIPDAKARLALADAQYPSARVCGECHPNQFRQWSNSNHAYAGVSPMFNKFEQKINDLASGTINYFCVRCHSSVGTSLGERRDISWARRSGAAQEGITCVTCHRVGEGYGKTNGARRITPGTVHEAVFGPFDIGLKAISDARIYQVLVSNDERDRPNESDGSKWIRIHQSGIKSDLIHKSELCAPCHQVQVHPGIKLETVWEEYRVSPAAKDGITCQNCHMSPNPGQPLCPDGKDRCYPIGWAARIPRASAPNGGLTVNDNRPVTDHTFIGPGYPISHPGLFPLRMEESPFTPDQWLKFDYRADWGSDAFEAKVAAAPNAYTFPPLWQSAADRKVAGRIVKENLDRWKERRLQRIKLLEGASHIDGPFMSGRPEAGKSLSFTYKVSNLNRGHNLPSGSLGAQPELWLNVALLDPAGNVVWESGYEDSFGDVADLQSEDVQKGKIPFDRQLVSMQAKFITTNLKGTDREMYLPINLDVDQRPFIRPGSAPTSVLNHPPFARMEKRSIPPLGCRVANYKVPGDKLKRPGIYRLSVRLRARTEPIYFMKFVEATKDMIRTENEWSDEIHPYAVEFQVY